MNPSPQQWAECPRCQSDRRYCSGVGATIPQGPAGARICRPVEGDYPECAQEACPVPVQAVGRAGTMAGIAPHTEVCTSLCPISLKTIMRIYLSTPDSRKQSAVWIHGSEEMTSSSCAHIMRRQGRTVCYGCRAGTRETASGQRQMVRSVQVAGSHTVPANQSRLLGAWASRVRYWMPHACQRTS